MLCLAIIDLWIGTVFLIGSLRVIFLGHDVALVPSRILGVPPDCKKTEACGFCGCCWASIPTQLPLRDVLSTRPVPAASFHFPCMSCCLRVLDVGFCRDQQMWYFSSIPSTLQHSISLDIRKPLLHQTVSCQEATVTE